jgi:hypothetical protein
MVQGSGHVVGMFLLARGRKRKKRERYENINMNEKFHMK